jgi:hypothetical protein
MSFGFQPFVATRGNVDLALGIHPLQIDLSSSDPILGLVQVLNGILDPDESGGIPEPEGTREITQERDAEFFFGQAVSTENQRKSDGDKNQHDPS